jgi:hypothetical protein
VLWPVVWTVSVELVPVVSVLAGGLISEPVCAGAAGGSPGVAGRFAAAICDTTLAGSAARACPATNASKAIVMIAVTSRK